jgi:hypothetical protein
MLAEVSGRVGRTNAELHDAFGAGQALPNSLPGFTYALKITLAFPGDKFPETYTVSRGRTRNA